MSTNKNIDGLTGLRGYAALWVMFFHSWGIIIPIYGGDEHLKKLAAMTGPTAVDTFFVLTGFLLFLPFAEKLLNPQKEICLKEYFWNRVKRILPAYYVQMIILGGLGLFGLYEDATISSWIAHIFMLHNLSISWVGNINGVWWTLPTEFEFYLLLPLLFLFIQRFGLFVFLPCCLLVAIAYKIIIFYLLCERDIGSKSWLLGQLPGSMDLFGWGIMASIIYTRYIQSRRQQLYLSGLLLMMVGLGGMFFILHYARLIGRNDFWDGHYLLFLWGTINGSMILCLVLSLAIDTTFSKMLFANKIAIYCGTVSYSIYLWHFPLARLIFKNERLLPHIKHHLLLTSVAYIVLIFIIADLSYRFIERPCMRIAFKRKDAILTAGACDDREKVLPA